MQAKIRKLPLGNDHVNDRLLVIPFKPFELLTNRRSGGEQSFNDYSSKNVACYPRPAFRKLQTSRNKHGPMNLRDIEQED